MELQIVQGSFYYESGESVLRNLNLTIREGTFLCVLGQNGIGKTTFLKCLTGILRWSEGYTRFDGEICHNIFDKSEVAYVPQGHPTTFPYTALDMVCMGRSRQMGKFSMPSAKDQQIAMESLKEMGISHLADRKCSKMSGGQLQMVYIARAMVTNPRLLILDEPETHLDFKNQAEILNKLGTWVRERKISCIMNTHYPEHALKMADKVLLLGKDGDYVFGKTQDIMTSENIERFFQVGAKIVDLKTLGIQKKVFVICE